MCRLKVLLPITQVEMTSRSLVAVAPPCDSTLSLSLAIVCVSFCLFQCHLSTTAFHHPVPNSWMENSFVFPSRNSNVGHTSPETHKTRSTPKETQSQFPQQRRQRKPDTKLDRTTTSLARFPIPFNHARGCSGLSGRKDSTRASRNPRSRPSVARQVSRVTRQRPCKGNAEVRLGIKHVTDGCAGSMGKCLAIASVSRLGMEDKIMREGLEKLAQTHTTSTSGKYPE
jgi:hypothetical protein